MFAEIQLKRADLKAALLPFWPSRRSCLTLGKLLVGILRIRSALAVPCAEVPTLTSEVKLTAGERV